MTPDEFLRESSRIHDEWAKTARVVVDPRYINDPSYAENIEAVSAIAGDERVYLAMVGELMDRYNRSNGRPTRAERRAAYKARRAQQEGNPPKGRPTEGEE